MAIVKKKPGIVSDLENADLMTLLSGEGNAKVFSKNDLIDYSYPTGISIIDYALGYEIIVKDENNQFVKKRTCLGLQAGSFNVITGRTQSFKTTISTQITSNIAYPFNGNIIHYDAENRLVLQRVKTLSKLPDEWFRGEHPLYSLRSGGIGYDTLQSDIAEIYHNKMMYKDLLLKDTGEVDDQNRPIKLMPPTIILLDSLQDVIQKEYEINNDKRAQEALAELRSNMYGAQTAKTIRGLLTDILPMLKEANIIFLCIAHKTSNMNLQGFGGAKKQFQYGEADERISGGSAVEFNASAVINLTGVIRDDMRYHMDTDGFEGNTVLFEPTKASTNESGNKKTGLGFNIVVDKRKNGVDNLRTLILFLNDRGRLRGNKAGFKVINKNGEIVSEKFTWKKVYEDFMADKKIYKEFMLAAHEELSTLISKAEDTSGQIKVFNMNDILNELNSDVA